MTRLGVTMTGRALCSCLGLLAMGCTLPQQRSSIAIVPNGSAIVPASRMRSAFDVRLVPKGQSPTATGGVGRVTISARPDEVLEYSLQIDNRARDTYTQATLLRVTPDSTSDVVAVLFADVMLRGPRISVRGTASLMRTAAPEVLLAELRGHMGEYVVQVEGANRSLVGYLGLAND